ncbi:MAG TPA: carboxylesterase family protein [Polyangiaceae bacterium]|nr:carboxylesterase family protein [Polyangiaceae bacterium]
MLRRKLRGYALSTIVIACTACGSDNGKQGGGGAGNVVTVPNVGTLSGTATSTMRSFKGIPYAAPPKGSLRWMPPQKAAPLTGTFDATKFGSGCAQPQSYFGTASNEEDCLFLNVYTPVGTGPYPVMVWIHGGAFLYGESTEYDPTPLVAQGVVVVTLNYRLGMFGFLAHPAIDNGAGVASTNFGLLDQQFALKWVQDNIESFGGDKGNVTIFGESAGGFSVESQLVMPGAHGLFHKAIVESGAYGNGNALEPTLDTAQMQGASFATAAKCPTPCTADFLRNNLSTAEVLTAQNALMLQTVLPASDGTVIPSMGVGTAFASGAFEKVPVIEGSNHDEWALFVGAYLNQTNTKLTTDMDYQTAAAATFGVSSAIAMGLIANYPLSNYMNNPNLALTAAGTDFIFACPMRVAAGQLSAAQVPTFSYEFSDENAPELFLPVPPSDPSFVYGAAHASEIQYLFNMDLASHNGKPFTADQQALSATMVKYWTQFAKTGNPNIAGSPMWPAYTASTDGIMTLNTPAASVQVTTAFKTEHKCM